MSKEYSRFQFFKDINFETNHDLKKHIVPSPPVKVRKPVKREPNVPLWETEWSEAEKAMGKANERLGALLEKNRATAPDQDHTE